MTASDRKTALRLFNKQIECILRDDRKAQMDLYAEDLRYEFPFADDRPRLIEGRKAFQKVMEPLWAKARKKGIRVVGCDSKFHATDEEDLFLAIFNLKVQSADKMLVLPFIQLIRVEGGRIIEVKEYFNSPVRDTAIKSA